MRSRRGSSAWPRPMRRKGRLSMLRDEINALGELAGEAVSSVATQVRDTHAGVAGRVFGNLGPAATPVRVIHDRLSESAYAGARGLTAALVRGGARALSMTRSTEGQSMHESIPGRLVVGALNGAWGGHPRAARLA